MVDSENLSLWNVSCWHYRCNNGCHYTIKAKNEQDAIEKFNIKINEFCTRGWHDITAKKMDILE